ncbi:MAG: FAD-dependent catabolic D-arginine dehydrogenase DauA [Candidatus Omnitrophica bacterium]|nr:FAD-dependent catabolic D-arginine dehydrogenase DauA [Candidatus Omnitrophota bacterium]
MLVVGAGLAGLSTAWHLLRDRSRRVVVLEQDDRPGGRSSGRNAGMIRQALTDPELCALAVEGRGTLERWAKAHPGLGWARTGSLILADGRQRAQLSGIRSALKRQGVRSEPWSHRKAAARIAPLEGAELREGIFCPSDARLDIHRLVTTLTGAVRAAGGRVVLGARVAAIRRNPAGFTVRTAKGAYRAPVVVNAAGAWASRIAYLAGASRMPLAPYRRHLYECAYRDRTAANWPFVWDLSADLYFRPIQGGLLMSPCDKRPFRPGAAGRLPGGEESTDRKVREIFIKKAAEYSPSFSGLRILKERAGLRTMTPDGRFLIGPDPVLEGFHWAAGLGGHGVTTAFPVGRLAAASALGRAQSSELGPHLPSRYRRRTGER